MGAEFGFVSVSLTFLFRTAARQSTTAESACGECPAGEQAACEYEVSELQGIIEHTGTTEVRTSQFESRGCRSPARGRELEQG